MKMHGLVAGVLGRLVLGSAAATSLLLTAGGAEAQLSYTKGQSISPAYEGFEVNPDGSYELLFGYMNRNWEEELDIPVGSENYFSPGPEDRGQPTHFLPRRNRFTFKVHVPADFGEQELVWTLVSQGEERKAYASLRQDLLVDNMIIASETGALGAGRSDPETRSNVPPVIELETEREISARIGQPVTLIAKVTDDGLPVTVAQRRARAAEARRAEAEAAGDADAGDASDAGAADARDAGAGNADAADANDANDDAQGTNGDAADANDDAQGTNGDAEEEISPELRELQQWLREPNRVTVNKAVGLHFTWFVYRGENEAAFDPIQIESWEDSRAWHDSPWAPYWEPPPVPDDDRWIVNVTFDEPGTYVLRGRADDGALYADTEVTVQVAPLLP